MLLFGTAAGTLTVALDALVISLWLARKGHPFYRLAFNICALPASLWVGAHVFFAIWGGQPLSNSKPVEIGGLLAPLILFTVTYFLLNSWLIAFAISLEKHLSPLGVWKDNFARLSLNYFGGASVAALLVTYTRNIDLAYLAFVLPLLAVLYFTFSTSLGRVEDANKHLSALNSLYMSTIETLAMAIDAKDQITHGHIRRVQQYATGLAHAIGVKDPAQIKAIEAASLLHDMGKLAVPEYILNKPGSLTPAEFEKMKVHASVGADILSAIDFPYPVVPIVRHHHESWDGTGYPDGLAGSQIPIGARILAVVDCFDALTSDRPYRPRLSDAEAIEILMERRGRMYDPLIVDAFIQVHRQIAPQDAKQHDSAPHTLSVWKSAVGTTEPVTSGTRLDDISASTEETLALYQLAQTLSGELHLDDVARTILTHTRRLIPTSTGVFFAYDEDSDELFCLYALGEHATQFQGLRIPRGQRLSGWVAASERTIVNSDPVLDLGEVARTMRPRLRSCLSTALIGSSGLAGVLTLYSTQQDAFDENHRRVIEAIARHVAETVRRAIRATSAGSESDAQLVGLPNRHQLQRFIQAELGSNRGQVPLSLVFVSIRFAGTSSPKSPRQPIRVVDAIRKNLRDGDILFRYSSSELVVLLSNTDSITAISIVTAISEELLPMLSANDKSGDVATVSLGTASAPSDGTTAESLVGAARSRQHRGLDRSQPRNSVH